MATSAPSAPRPRIRVALVGVGNCASALVQGLSYYGGAREAGGKAGAAAPTRPGLGSPGFPPDAAAAAAAPAALPRGLMRPDIGGYAVGDVDVVLAFDVDARKVGKPVREAIVTRPNCCFQFATSDCDAPVLLAPALDGIAAQVASPPCDAARGVIVHADASGDKAPTLASLMAAVIRERVAVIVNYLPVGSQAATELWATIALGAGCAFVNCIPVFIASDAAWEAKFTAARLPIIGDDMCSQYVPRSEQTPLRARRCSHSLARTPPTPTPTGSARASSRRPYRSSHTTAASPSSRISSRTAAASTLLPPAHATVA
jgi:myo-inositol-1-phosphate synthase